MSALEALQNMATHADSVAASERDLAVQSAMFFKLGAVAMAAEALFKAHRLEMSAAAMGDRWRVLEDALNEWRAGK